MLIEDVSTTNNDSLHFPSITTNNDSLHYLLLPPANERGNYDYSDKICYSCNIYFMQGTTLHGNIAIFPCNYGVVIKLFCDKFVRGNTVVLEPCFSLQE